MRSIGDICRIVGMKNDTKINGLLCEILTPLVKNTIPEHDGVAREAMRYGIRILGMDATGYARPENLAFEVSAHDRTYEAKRRACFIHATGDEEHENESAQEDMPTLDLPTTTMTSGIAPAEPNDTTIEPGGGSFGGGGGESSFDEPAPSDSSSSE